MQPTANAQAQRDIIRFAPNVPTMVTLDYDDGTPSPGQYGEQWRYSVNSGRGVFWVDPPVRDLIRQSGAYAGDSVVITKEQQGSRARWKVEKVEDEPEQPKRPVASPAKAAAAAAAAAAPAPANQMAAALRVAFDACVSLREYAGAKGHALSFDFGDVRSIAATLYIQAHKGNN